MAKTYGLVFTNSDPRVAPATSLAPTLVIFSAIDGTVVSTPGVTKPITSVGLYTFQYTPSLPVFFLADGGTFITDNTQRYLYGILDPLHKVDEQVDQLSTTLTARNQTLVALGNSGFALGTTAVALGTTSVALGNTSVALSTTIAVQAQSLSAQSSSIFAQSTTILGYGVSTYAAALTILAQTQTLMVNINISASLIADISNRIGTTLSSIGSTSIDPGDLFGYLKRLQEFNEGEQNFNKTSGVWNISTRGNTLFVSKTLTNSSTQVNRI